MAQIVGGFHRRHEQLYSYAADDTPVELVNLRVTAIGKIDQPQVATLRARHGGGNRRLPEPDRFGFMARAHSPNVPSTIG